MRLRRANNKPAWLSRDILRALRRKRKMWKKERCTQISEEYKAVEKNVKKLIRQAKRNHEKKVANENGGNNKPFYAYVKGKTKSKVSIGPLKNGDNQTVADSAGMATLLNDYFSSVFTAEPEGEVPAAVDGEQRNKLLDIEISERDILRKIKNLWHLVQMVLEQCSSKSLKRRLSPTWQHCSGKFWMTASHQETGSVPMSLQFSRKVLNLILVITGQYP